jgi:hypothetical protein
VLSHLHSLLLLPFGISDERLLDVTRAHCYSEPQQQWTFSDIM